MIATSVETKHPTYHCRQHLSAHVMSDNLSLPDKPQLKPCETHCRACLIPVFNNNYAQSSPSILPNYVDSG
jgi:hypothetical protein